MTGPGIVEVRYVEEEMVRTKAKAQVLPPDCKLGLPLGWARPEQILYDSIC